ncbi:MAG: hypothetical protein ACREQ9_07970, partial [Candidatus Binatia bacterium]
MRLSRMAAIGAASAWLGVASAALGLENVAALAARLAQLEGLLAEREREVAHLREYSQRLLDDMEETRGRLGAAERERAEEHRLRLDEKSRLRRERIDSQTALQ